MLTETSVPQMPTGDLKNLIKNHRDKAATDRPIYLAAIREYENRSGRGLQFQKSFEIIRAAAREGRFLSYQDLADESGVTWAKVRHEIGGHLGRLVEYGERMGWPMLSAIVVNKPHVKTGDMEEQTLDGFIAAAEALGRSVPDRRAFLKEQQAAVFAWGAEQVEAGSAEVEHAPA